MREGEEEGEEMDKWDKRKGKVFRKVRFVTTSINVANWVYLRGDGICRVETRMFSFLLFFFLCFFPKKNQFYYIPDFMSLISLYRIIYYIHTYIYYFAIAIAICYNILTKLTYIQLYIHLYNTYAIVTIALNLIFYARVLLSLW